ncbi:hypothetical protein LCM23_06150 [Cytobacillus kochii]|uniref:hypothetical protein n=1 Tax=Cytobacillus kochii TaxID=859143 RepID=UPI001CD196F0|nr:hypothetical protein [Cytobacillus kochii]MCA1025666.1 hypothetical protein [Cytobacillus kochii]
MPTFDSMKDLEKYVNSELKTAMVRGNNVRKTVVNEGRKQVDQVVYNAYTPKVYNRTGSLRESWAVEEAPDGIDVVNTRRDGDKDVARTVETGQGYDYTGGYPYERPRPFIAATVNALENNDKLTDSLRKDMINNGLDME